MKSTSKITPWAPLDLSSCNEKCSVLYFFWHRPGEFPPPSLRSDLGGGEFFSKTAKDLVAMSIFLAKHLVVIVVFRFSSRKRTCTLTIRSQSIFFAIWLRYFTQTSYMHVCISTAVLYCPCVVQSQQRDLREVEYSECGGTWCLPSRGKNEINKVYPLTFTSWFFVTVCVFQSRYSILTICEDGDETDCCNQKTISSVILRSNSTESK